MPSHEYAGGCHRRPGSELADAFPELKWLVCDPGENLNHRLQLA